MGWERKREPGGGQRGPCGNAGSEFCALWSGRQTCPESQLRTGALLGTAANGSPVPCLAIEGKV